MNKFLKGAVVCGALIPCMTGLMACTEDSKKPAVTGEEAYNAVFERVNGYATQMSGITTPGKEFQLSINISMNAKVSMQGSASGSTSFGMNLRAVIGAIHGENMEMFGAIGAVDTQNQFKSIISAYALYNPETAVNYVDVTELVAADVAENAENWTNYEGLLYTQNGNEYVLVDGAYDATATYYVLEDLLHLYLASDPTAFEIEGMDLNDILAMATGGEFALPQGKIHATLNLAGVEEDEEPETPELGGDDAAQPDIDGILENIQEIKDMTYAEFVEMINEDAAEGGPEYTVTGEKASNGDISMKMTTEGAVIRFIAKAEGGLAISMDMTIPQEGVTQEISLTIEIDLEEEVDEQYIPQDLASYGASAGNIEDVIMGLLGGIEE